MFVPISDILTRVREEDALPLVRVRGVAVHEDEVKVGLGRGEPKGGQQNHHEQQIPEQEKK